jgi:predicted metal-binding membrane protein
MASLVALGVMSLTWMILTWTLVMAERLLPSRRLATVGVAFILAALAIGVAVGAPISPVPAHGSAPM